MDRPARTRSRTRVAETSTAGTSITRPSRRWGGPSPPGPANTTRSTSCGSAPPPPPRPRPGPHRPRGRPPRRTGRPRAAGRRRRTGFREAAGLRIVALQVRAGLLPPRGVADRVIALDEPQQRIGGAGCLGVVRDHVLEVDDRGVPGLAPVVEHPVPVGLLGERL